MRYILSSAALLLAAVPALAFDVTSPQLLPGKPMSKAQEYNGFGCNGGNVSPALRWKDAPAGSKSFAVTVYDPDAPTGSGWWHWLVFNLPADTRELASGAGNPGGVLPAGSVQSRTDYGVPGFGGACPPQGDRPHRYIFTVHALKVDKLELGADAMPALVGYMLNANSLGKTSLIATYGR
ncbi:YbhB/YbcL family Raf kinase inhibitor-like protein [Vogesella oryzae]|uniref:YbhB/YbcL family Raf kinase inhibitor-like protein n=1 Tax=Vogesella oryzae TaxID=1735285 RepID=UPI0015816CC2|nr:YbhB/YbcL family Raf kinase inhibitor-like protein [Vogesella oryzae]